MALDIKLMENKSKSEVLRLKMKIFYGKDSEENESGIYGMEVIRFCANVVDKSDF